MSNHDDLKKSHLQKPSALWRVFFALLSGLMLALAFPFPSIEPFAWFALVPLLFALSSETISRGEVSPAPGSPDSNSRLRSALYGFLFGFTFYAILLYWIQVFGYLPWVSLAFALAVWYVFFAVIVNWIMKNNNTAGRLIMIPVLWMLLEFARSYGSWGFGWGNIGSTVNNSFIASIASYVGEIGLGGVIVFFNVVMFEALLAIRLRTYRREAIVAIILFVLALSVVSDTLTEDDMYAMKASQITNKRENTVSIAAIQPNITQSIKVSGRYNEAIKSVYTDLTYQALNEPGEPLPDLVVWPESVLVAYLNDEKAFYGGMKSYVNKKGVSFLFGALSKENKNTVYNNAVFATPFKNEQTYQKIHLVPFGEFMPMRGIVEKLNETAKLVVDKSPGSRHSVFILPHHAEDMDRLEANSKLNISKGDYAAGRFSSIICFESADSALVGELVKKGARMIIVLTNDGWFGETAALEQHFRISRMRAIEYGVPVVQVANTGVTGFIDKDGRVVRRITENKRSIVKYSMEFSEESGVYAALRSWLPFLLCLVFASGVASVMINKKSQ